MGLNPTPVSTSGSPQVSRPAMGVLDPRTGQPLRHCLESVSVVHEQCMMADGLATALLCMGAEKGLAYARRNSIAAVFIARAERGLAVEMTDKFRDLAESGLSQG